MFIYVWLVVCGLLDSRDNMWRKATRRNIYDKRLKDKTNFDAVHLLNKGAGFNAIGDFDKVKNMVDMVKIKDIERNNTI